MIYYGMLASASAMFGTQFLFKQVFRKNYKSNSMEATAVSGFGGAIFGLISMLFANGFSLEYSHFSMFVALLQTVNGFLFTYCSMKALGKINLSLYSIFSMLGGMALPFATGILFFDETLTPGTCICFILITLSFLLTLKKGDSNVSEKKYYVGVFLFNGMSGVISKFYYAADYERISAAGYSILVALLSIVVYLVMLLFLKPDLSKLNPKAVGGILGSGVLNKMANWLMLLALAHVPASAEYPFITGGTMIVSTILSYFTKDKPTKRELLSILIAFIGVLALII